MSSGFWLVGLPQRTATHDHRYSGSCLANGNLIYVTNGRLISLYIILSYLILSINRSTEVRTVTLKCPISVKPQERVQRVAPQTCITGTRKAPIMASSAPEGDVPIMDMADPASATVSAIAEAQTISAGRISYIWY